MGLACKNQWSLTPLMFKMASATFAMNATGTAIKVGQKAGNIWKTIEQPILKWRGIAVDVVP